MKKNKILLLLVALLMSTIFATLAKPKPFATLYGSTNATGAPCVLLSITVPVNCSTTNTGPQCTIIINGVLYYLYAAIQGTNCFTPLRRPF